MAPMQGAVGRTARGRKLEEGAIRRKRLEVEGVRHADGGSRGGAEDAEADVRHPESDRREARGWRREAEVIHPTFAHPCPTASFP